MISLLRSSLESRLGSSIPSRVAMKSGFSSRPSLSATISDIYLPIAGALESPGDSMPARSKKNSASSASPTMNSCDTSCALSPLKLVITCLSGTSSTARQAFSLISSSPAAVVFTPSRSIISSAVGPTIMLPCTVGLISTPLPSSVGSWNTVWLTKLPTDLSSSMYSPRLGVMCICRRLTMLCSTSA